MKKLRMKLKRTENFISLLLCSSGPLAATEFCSVLAFLQDKDSVSDANFPDYQLYFVEAVAIFFLQLGVTPEVI